MRLGRCVVACGKQPFTLQKISKPRAGERCYWERSSRSFRNHIWDTTIVTNCYHIKGWPRSWHFVLDVLLLQKMCTLLWPGSHFTLFLANAFFDAIGDRRLIFSINKKGGRRRYIFQNLCTEFVETLMLQALIWKKIAHVLQYMYQYNMHSEFWYLFQSWRIVKNNLS